MYVDRTPKTAAALVVVQDRIKAGSIPVEKIFVPEWIVVTIPFARVTEQRLRILLERLQSGFEPQTTDVYGDSIADGRIFPRCDEIDIVVGCFGTRSTERKQHNKVHQNV